MNTKACQQLAVYWIDILRKKKNIYYKQGSFLLYLLI
jgi:hypothetical protein